MFLCRTSRKRSEAVSGRQGRRLAPRMAACRGVSAGFQWQCVRFMMPCCVTRPDGTFAPIYFKYFKGGFHGPNCLGMFLGRAKLEVSEAPSTKYTHISSDLPWRGRGWFTSARKEGISFSVMQKVGNTLLLLPVFIYSLYRKEEKRTLKKKKVLFFFNEQFGRMLSSNSVLLQSFFLQNL